MKKGLVFLNYLLSALLALFLVACQDEFEVVDDNNDEEVIEVGSETAVLIANTSANDGSFDNIVDQASCFSIQFPYEIIVAGSSLTIDAAEDFEIIEELFDDVDTDEDVLEVVFPVTLVFEDFSEVEIQRFEQLEDFAEDCLEGGLDEDIECIDFVYPITLFTLNVEREQPGSVNISNDRQMRRLFRDLRRNERVSIDFPVTLQDTNGNEITVSTNRELAAALEEARDSCDEDDDNDYSDDDFEENRFVSYLTECYWELLEIRRFGNDQNQEYRNFRFDFNQDGLVEIITRQGNLIEGEWTYEFTRQGVLIALEFNEENVFEAEWLLADIGKQRIKFFTNKNNTMVLGRRCGDHEDSEEEGISGELLARALQECEWVIKDFAAQNEAVTGLLGFGITFFDDGNAELSGQNNSWQGSYTIEKNQNNITSLRLNFQDFSALNLEWPVHETDGQVDDDVHWILFKREGQGQKLQLRRQCIDQENETVLAIQELITTGQWEIDSFQVGNEERTGIFSNYRFDFADMHRARTFFNGELQGIGLWRILASDETAESNVLLNFERNGELLSSLSGCWEIDSFGEDQFNFIIDEGFLEKKLVLTKTLD